MLQSYHGSKNYVNGGFMIRFVTAGGRSMYDGSNSLRGNCIVKELNMDDVTDTA